MILIDSSVFVAYGVEQDENHQKAVETINKIIRGDFGAASTTDYVFDETVTVTLIRSKSVQKAALIGKYIKESVNLLKVDDDLFEESWARFKGQQASRFSFTDSSTAAVMASKGIRHLATFDKEFKKIESINVVG